MTKDLKISVAEDKLGIVLAKGFIFWASNTWKSTVLLLTGDNKKDVSGFFFSHLKKHTFSNSRIPRMTLSFQIQFIVYLAIYKCLNLILEAYTDSWTFLAHIKTTSQMLVIISLSKQNSLCYLQINQLVFHYLNEHSSKHNSKAIRFSELI